MWIVPTVFYWNPALEKQVKIALVVGSAIALYPLMNETLLKAIEDLKLGHASPTLSKEEAKWTGSPNTYSTLSGSSVTVTPYLMEDFLYEKPFVALRVTSANDKSEKPVSDIDSLGLCQIDSLTDSCVSLVTLDTGAVQADSLTFTSASDWKKLGVKKDTWTRVAGVDDSVPIRHVARYAMPDVVVKDYIQRYRFVVDDLMPNRLRQIRLTFNYNESVAWECDPDDNTATPCGRFVRTAGGDWTSQGKVAHPVQKNGTFDFDASDVYDNLLQIQKDNQNVVNVYTVNKVGLTNTQRFYYLFKATADLVEPGWPMRDVAVTRVDSFHLYASALDYQDLSFVSGRDQLFAADSFPDSTAWQAMGLEASGEGWEATSARDTSLGEGEYVYDVKLTEATDGDSSGEWEEMVPFTVDTTAPGFALTAEGTALNPDSSVYMARVTLDTAKDKSLRLVRMRLKDLSSGTVYAMPPLRDAANMDFGVAWNSLDTLPNGIYRLVVAGIDAAAPDRATYEGVNDLAALVNDSTEISSFTKLWDSVITGGSESMYPKSGLNGTVDSCLVRIDRQAPSFAFWAVNTYDSSEDQPTTSYSSTDTLMLNQTSLLRIYYTLQDSLWGRDSAVVSVNIRFVDLSDTTIVHQAGASDTLVSDQVTSFGWLETAEMQLEDGDYRLEVRVQDEAGNQSSVVWSKVLHVDRTPAVISEALVGQLVYDSLTDSISATLYVSQENDLSQNKSALQCYYRVTGGAGVTPAWVAFDSAETRSQSATNDDPVKVKFHLDSAQVGADEGKRYMEAGCLDLAGNFAFRTDLFHIGDLYPTITSPTASLELSASKVVIRGLAPVSVVNGVDGESTYRLRWRSQDTTGNWGEWQSAGMDVGAGKRLADSLTNQSNEAQPVEGDLGTWDRSDLDAGTYQIQLSTQACSTCEWLSDTMSVGLGTVWTGSDTLPVIAFNLPASLTPGEDTLPLQIRLDGPKSSATYRARMYAEDAGGNAMFEASTEVLKTSPYSGAPTTVPSGDGIWFWEGDSGKYYLQWSGLPTGDTLRIHYAAGSVDSACRDSSGQALADCSEESVTAVSNPTDSTCSIAEICYLWDTDRQMELYAASGLLEISAEGAFMVDLVALLDTTGSLVLPVYLGEDSDTGIVSDGAVVPLTAFFTVDPLNYGFTYRWNGLSSTGDYPDAGLVTLYAEIIENDDDGLALDSSATLQVTLPALQVVSGSDSVLGTFYVISQNSSGSVILGKKSLSYGIHGRDAYVSALVLGPDGDTVRTLLDSAAKDAATSATAYSLLWDGKDDEGHVVTTAGTYRFAIQAWERNGTQTASLSRSFALSVSAGLVNIASGGSLGDSSSALQVEEAVTDPDDSAQFLYEPQADYLVQAQVTGKYLPDSLRSDTIDITAAGTQTAIGYPPQRFSLGIKRQRKELELGIVYKVDRYQYHHTDYNLLGDGSCDDVSDGNIPAYGSFSKNFYEDSLTITDTINLPSNSDHAYRTEDIWQSKISLYAYFPADRPDGVTDSAWYSLIGKNGTGIWYREVSIPIQTMTYSVTNSADTDVGCLATDSSVCEYSQNQTTDGYDPNNNLFTVTLNPLTNDSKWEISPTYYGNFGELRDGYIWCDNDGYRRLKFSVTLDIPDSYWNAGFGYDNLVNRTIRFDPTNKTLFGSTNGYYKVLEDSASQLSPWVTQTYHDGKEWGLNKNYGFLTPFETQRLNFVGADVIAGGLNPFLFSDETAANQQVSRYTLKFYNQYAKSDLLALVHADFESSSSALVRPYVDKTYPFPVSASDTSYRKTASLYSDEQDSMTTSYSEAGNTSFSVALLSAPEDFNDDEVSVAFPTDSTWTDAVSGKCSDSQDWTAITANEADCSKFYLAGSRAHYYVDDYSDETWDSVFLNSSGYINNYGLLGDAYSGDPDLLDSLGVDSTKLGLSTVAAALPVRFDSSQHTDSSFYLTAADLDLSSYDSLVNLAGFTVTASPTVRQHPSDITWNSTARQLEAKAKTWTDPALDSSRIVYRKWLDSLGEVPELNGTVDLTLRRLYANQRDIVASNDSTASLFLWHSSTQTWLQNPWIFNLAGSGLKITQIDGTAHSHLQVAAGSDSLDYSAVVSRKSSPLVARAPELVTLRGQVPGAGTSFQVSYVKDSVFNDIISDTMGTVRGDTSDLPFIDWFDVNHLQGNTSLLLTWGASGGSDLYFRQLDLNIGSPTSDDGGTVSSIYGEVSVTFPDSSLASRTDVTVRTVDASEYNFSTYNDVTVRGTVIEVQPSMTFSEPYPRIKARLSKTDLGDLAQTPDRVRLYKVDFANQKLVALENSLYGYLNSNGSPAVSTADTSTGCSDAYDLACYPGADNWTYLLISAETKTFSSFVVLDANSVDTSLVSFSVVPQVASSLEREVRISGVSAYHLYVDDDSVWSDTSDATPPGIVEDSLHADSTWWITVPDQDASWIFLVPLSSDSTESVNAPYKQKVQVVSSEFSCDIEDSLVWLGLDNGHLEFWHECTHPAVGQLQIRKSSSVVAQVSGSAGDTLVWDGYVGLNKLPAGTYTSRYQGYSVVGNELQMVGPEVKTDALRPVIDSLSVTESQVLLDRSFLVHAVILDASSGVDKVRFTAVLGADTLEKTDLEVEEDNTLAHALLVPRATLASCLGCGLEINLVALDYGHNHRDTSWTSESLYPYPIGLALWYPMGEGSGTVATEMTGTGHDLGLSMSNPWRSGSSLYFAKTADVAAGEGSVSLSLEDSSAMTLEFWIKPGRDPSGLWRRIVGWTPEIGTGWDIQAKGTSLRFVAESSSWTATSILPNPKTSGHVVVVAKADSLILYRDGVRSAELHTGVEPHWLTEGTLSVGKGDSLGAYLGNLWQVRVYSRALGDAEVNALFYNIGSGEDSAEVEVANANSMSSAEGASREFSCSVPGSAYWLAGDSGATLTWSAYSAAGGTYGVYLYARSASADATTVSIGKAGEALQTGTVEVSTQWQALSVDGVLLELDAGYSSLKMQVPAGMQIAGVALSSDPYLESSRITWSDAASGDAASGLSVQVKFESLDDLTWIRPRLRLTNTGDTTIVGFRVRYYFKGELASEVLGQPFYPSDGDIAVRQEADNLGYAEWDFPTTDIAVGASPFWGEGPYFGLHQNDYALWGPTDDPSFVEEADGVYQDASAIIVLDQDNRTLTGASCFEDESAVTTTPTVQLKAKDILAGGSSASQLYLLLDNIGQVPLRNYQLLYHFYVPGGATPVFDGYDMQGFTGSLDSLGANRWTLALQSDDNSLSPGEGWSNPLQFALHLADWVAQWSADDDPSHEDLDTAYALAYGIEVLDSNGNRIWGHAPEWPDLDTATVVAKVIAKETRPDETNSSGIRLAVVNTGSISLSDFSADYWFSADSGKTPQLRVDYSPQADVSLEEVNDTLWLVHMDYSGVTLVAGDTTESGDGLEFALYYGDWSSWDKEDDFSHVDLDTSFADAEYVALYNSGDTLIWGTEPVIPVTVASSSDPGVEVKITDDGFVVYVTDPATFRMDLVNVAGIPLLHLFSGYLAAGSSTVISCSLDGYSATTTYLLVRKNGQIVLSQTLSQIDKE